MQERHLTIINKLGLHVRAATQLVKIASDSDADVTITCNGQTADAKSIMEVLMLAATMETEVVLTAQGEPEEEARVLDTLAELIKAKFHEKE